MITGVTRLTTKKWVQTHGCHQITNRTIHLLFYWILEIIHCINRHDLFQSIFQFQCLKRNFHPFWPCRIVRMFSRHFRPLSDVHFQPCPFSLKRCCRTLPRGPDTMRFFWMTSIHIFYTFFPDKQLESDLSLRSCLIFCDFYAHKLLKIPWILVKLTRKQWEKAYQYNF